MKKLLLSLLLLCPSLYCMQPDNTPNDGGCAPVMDMTQSNDSGSYSVDMTESHADAADLFTPIDVQIPVDKE
jgi:hypothetical protein